MDFNLLLRARPFVAQHLKKDFAAFVRSAWPHLHPGSKLSWTPAHDLICEYLVSVYRGDSKRLIINCPPRFSKSTIANVCWPVWLWLQDSTTAIMTAAYEIDLSLGMNADRRRLMESQWFKSLFGDVVQLSSDRSQAEDFSNTAGGEMRAVSVNSRAQGRGGDYIVVDDPLSADFAYSESFRNETNQWFSNQLPQRLNNPSESAIVVIAQRLHENDPCGFLLAQEDSEWTLLKLPLIAEEDALLTFPISGRIWKRRKGDCLDSKRWSPRTIKERQRNRLVWAGQFQQEPAPAEGNLIRTNDILFFGGRDPETGAMDPGLPESFERKIISVDCSFKDKATSDYVAAIVVGVNGPTRYLLHVGNSRLDLAGTENEVRALRSMYGPISAVLIEDAANGPSVINHLKEEIPGVIAVRPEGGKMARMVAASPEFQAHNWIIDRNGPWTSRVVQQLVLFPNAKNDDISDAIAQAAIWLQSNTYDLSWVSWLKKNGQAYLNGMFGREKTAKPAASTAQAPAPPQPVIASSRPKPEEKFTCPIRTCRSTATIRLGAPNTVHCNSCSCDFTPWGDILRMPPQEDSTGHVHRWREIPGGMLRCDDDPSHIRYVGDGQPQARNGMSRAQYAQHEKRRRGFGRFSN